MVSTSVIVKSADKRADCYVLDAVQWPAGRCPMRFRKALLVALVLLSECSAPEDTPRRVIGNGAYVSIFNIQNEKDATPFADRHCQRYGKSARLREMTGDRAVFECVSR